jgi:hypothetical protein
VSDSTTTTASTAVQTEQSPLILSVLPLLILFGAAAALFWLSTQDYTEHFRYWEIFVPVVAVLSLFSGWSQCQARGDGRTWYLVRQFVHWGTIIGLVYVFNVVGFRDMLSDQQYTVILVSILAAATLLAAIQMDYKLILFALFLAVCAYLMFVPTDNPVLERAGSLFRIDDPQGNPGVVTAALAGAGFVISLVILFMMPSRSVRTVTTGTTEAETTTSSGTPTATTAAEPPASMSSAHPATS